MRKDLTISLVTRIWISSREVRSSLLVTFLEFMSALPQNPSTLTPRYGPSSKATPSQMGPETTQSQLWWLTSPNHVRPSAPLFRYQSDHHQQSPERPRRCVTTTSSHSSTRWATSSTVCSAGQSSVGSTVRGTPLERPKIGV